MESEYIDILFDGPPGPESGRFVEVENDSGISIHLGEWVEEGAYWRLRIPILRSDVVFCTNCQYVEDAENLVNDDPDPSVKTCMGCGCGGSDHVDVVVVEANG